MRSRTGSILVSSLIATLAVGISFWIYRSLWGGNRSGNTLVVYCAHDSVYSKEVLDVFTEETGILIDVKFDTEATKSLGLVERIFRERAAPRCDVFWNNEILGTIRLAETGCLEPYLSPESDRFPDRFKDPTGLWTGFAGRLRVYIVHLGSETESPEGKVERLLAAGDLSPIAIAKPLYGTTLTHYAALWDEMGPEALKAWHQRCRDLGMVEASGNAAVKELVARRVCEVGFTDTDDVFVALDAEAPVTMIPIRLPSGKTVCIPNSVALVKGCPHPERARQLIDFLLSEKTERALAGSRSRQIPLGALTGDSKLPSDVEKIRRWTSNAADLKGISDARNECLDWLKSL